MMTSYDTVVVEPFKVIIDANIIACDYCEGFHLFYECLTNHVCVNFVATTNTITSTTTYTTRDGVIPMASHGVSPKVI